MRSKRMKLIASMARRDEEQLAQVFQAAENRVEEEMKRLLELKSYYQSYADMFSAKTQHIRAHEIVQSRQLLSRLAQAKTLQEKQIVKAKEELTHAKSQWQSSHLKRCSVDDLVERCQIDEQVEINIKEQKLMDEWIASTRVNR